MNKHFFRVLTAFLLMAILSGNKVFECSTTSDTRANCYFYNTRTGESTFIGTFDNTGT